MSSSACGKSGMRFSSVHSLGKGWQSPELLKAPEQTWQLLQKKKKKGRKEERKWAFPKGLQ